MTELGAYYLSFAGDAGWLGACFIRGSDDRHGMITPTNPVTRAHAAGCNPGGEVMVMPIPEEKAALIPAEFWETLLTKDDLRNIGAIVDPAQAGLVTGTADDLADGKGRLIE